MIRSKLKNVPKHNYMIDMLRFFAAFMVVMFHQNQAIPFADNWYQNLVKYGYLGVPVFFVISGYCILLSAYNSPHIKDFISRRLFRVFPAYWISLIIVLLVACFQKLYIGSNSIQHLPQSLVAILANIFLMTAPLNHIQTINWVYWSLTFELFFYFTIAILLPFRKSNLIYFFLAISFVSAIIPPQHSGILFFMDQWPSFGLGISLFYYFRFNSIWSFILFFTLLAINMENLLVSSSFSIIYQVISVLTFALILVSKYITVPNNFFAKLGRYSYAVYLIHVPIGVYVIGIFESKAIQKNPVLNTIYDLAVYTVVSILAVVIYNKVEKPGIAYGKNLSNNISALFQHTLTNIIRSDKFPNNQD